MIKEIAQKTAEFIDERINIIFQGAWEYRGKS